MYIISHNSKSFKFLIVMNFIRVCLDLAQNDEPILDQNVYSAIQLGIGQKDIIPISVLILHPKVCNALGSLNHFTCTYEKWFKKFEM